MTTYRKATAAFWLINNTAQILSQKDVGQKDNYDIDDDDDE